MTKTSKFYVDICACESVRLREVSYGISVIRSFTLSKGILYNTYIKLLVYNINSVQLNVQHFLPLSVNHYHFDYLHINKY